MSRRTVRAALALAAATAAAAATAPVAAATPAPKEIPIPNVVVTQVCGARNDVVTIDPAWLKKWGDVVTIFPASLTFQGGADGDAAKPAGQILPQYRADYVWAGNGGGWDSFWLYPGTVAPVVDGDVSCDPSVVPFPVMAQTVVCGPKNDSVDFADAVSAEHWTIASRGWLGTRLMVVLKAKPGFVGPDGTDVSVQEFRDDNTKCNALAAAR